MKELTLGMLLAVSEEVFGAGLFWLLIVLAALVIGLFLLVLIRDRGLVAGRFLWSEITAPIGAIAAILFVQFMTSSGFGDIGGPIDVIVLLMIGAAGAVVAPMLTYLALGLTRKTH